ncbi:MAG: branched-chain amino acid ABC transporter permease [Armatimonadota bacterium]|nr:branched-chain amino acid ABC transporter permease [Armatimonadota bacterium]MDR7489610.1 branched-chain amino acid ABC transporter permease [Armatimonadota bacterium]MDR7502768.1 branched-chain amino acid ABC transporter permease [Armatimonadota bacterium]MDR7528533.1 branched-chain amino acid ABC transporter permease [Armatimonadota bacterium]MDR7576569.1 branched-chain amino acid ABC transporter permease [Armatimonadota bacterium]
MDLPAVLGQVLVGLSRAMILFIVSAGLTLILGVLRVPNVFHGSLYMLGAFVAWTVAEAVGAHPAGLWLALAAAPLVTAAVGLVLERLLLSRLYHREHLMLILFTFGVMLILNDAVKLLWGPTYRSLVPPPSLQGAVTVLGVALPTFNLVLLAAGPLVGLGLWLFTHRTRAGRVARAAATDRDMVAVLGVDVNRVFGMAFALGCFLAGLGGALVAPTTSIMLGMDHSLLIDSFLIVIVGGLGNLWGALAGSLLFGVTQSVGLLVWPQFAVAFPYAVTAAVLLVRPTGLLRSAW